MSMMKTSRRCAYRTLLSVVGAAVCLLATDAKAVTTYNFDVNGATAGFGVTTGSTYDWDSTTNGGFWSNNTTSTTGNIATNGWVQGNFPKFQPASTPTYTITVGNGANEQITGIFASTAQTLTINAIGTGTLEAIAGDDGFLGSASADVTINAPIKGAGRVNPSNGGNLRLNAANTYTGGTLLSSTASLVHFGNDSAFGTGDMTISVAGFVPLLASGGTTRTIANNFVNSIASGGINFAADASTPTVSTGTWSLGANNLQLRNNGVTTSTLTLSGVISGTAGITLSSNNTGTILFTGANTYSGPTTITGPGATGAGSSIVILSLSSLTNGGASSSTLGSSSNAATNLVLVGGTLQYTGAATSTDRLFSVGTNTGSTSTIDASGTGAMNFTNTGSMGFNGQTGARTLTLTGTNTGSNTIAAVIGDNSGATSITKSGAGTWVLSGANTYSGTTAVNGGTLVMASAGAVPGANALTLGGGTLTNSTGATKTITGATTLTASSTIAGANDMAFSGAFTNSGANRTLTVNNTGATFGTVNLSEAAATGRTLTIGGSGNTTFGGVIQNASAAGAGNGTLAFASGYTGTATINGANTYTGATTLTGGAYTVSLGNKSAFGTSAVAANGVTITANTNLSGANAIGNTTTLGGNNTFTGSNNLEFSGTVTATGSRTVTNNMSGAILTLSGPVNLSSNANNNTVTVTGTGNTTISGAIANGGTATAANLTKSGNGTLTLSGTNTYGGTTTVTAGTLLVNGSNNGTGLVNVTGGTLGGSGSIAGSVTINGASASLSPGNSPGALSIGGSLSLASGSYKYEINSTPTATADLTNVTGALNITAAAVSLAASDAPGLFLAYGTKFTLINYGGAWNGGTFIGLPNYSTSLVVGANRYEIIYNDTTGGSNFGGGSLGGGSYVTITAVPEASAFLTVALGGIFAIAAVWMSKRLGVSVLKA